MGEDVEMAHCVSVEDRFVKMPDADLVMAARSDPAALAVLCGKYLRDVQRVCRRILRDTRAEDASQKAMLKFLQKVRAGKVETNVKAFLLTIARNTSIDVIRETESGRRKVKGLKESLENGRLDSYDSPYLQFEERSERKDAASCFQKLPERTRQIITLRRHDDLSFKEIGRVVGLENSRTTELYHEGAKELQRLMTERGW